MGLWKDTREEADACRKRAPGRPPSGQRTVARTGPRSIAKAMLAITGLSVQYDVADGSTVKNHGF